MMRMVFAVLFWMAGISGAAAHEVRPAIGDLSATDGQVTLELRLSVEPLLAGANLEGVEDTNDTDESDAVDALRMLDATALRDRLTQALPDLLASMPLTVDAAPVPLQATRIETEDVGNPDLPRETLLVLQGDLPAGAQTLEMNWPASFGTLILRQMGVDEPYTGYLTGQPSGPIQIAGGDALTNAGAFFGYIPVGFDHILPKGLDHILFVLGLFFLAARIGPLLWQVSAFTLAHTVTLALGALEIVTVSASIVEPIIAASIVYVAVENIVSDKLHRWRPAVVFGFGLLHGLGFASVLGEFGLPQGQFIAALIGFNIGVEIGQLTVIAVAFLLVWWALQVDRGRAQELPAQVFYGAAVIGLALAGYWIGGEARVLLWPLAGLSLLCLVSVSLVDRMEAYRRFVSIPASCVIAAVGAWWVVERVFL
ncbi:HupE/UreJ family protein [Thalassococcus sp. CAU 1522]|uniref:HupE/UreJ family protein n=1 Tax=Thalassococcus arenae TaxID=2851652 RepID=A0ABS6NAA1_9RHOB|nr:HupE/UreJ family protein [Thalassococcus arenae]MBV2360941.1 HupE/UreJ family protein [Thalassococcus arenae]